MVRYVVSSTHFLLRTASQNNISIHSENYVPISAHHCGIKNFGLRAFLIRLNPATEPVFDIGAAHVHQVMVTAEPSQCCHRRPRRSRSRYVNCGVADRFEKLNSFWHFVHGINREVVYMRHSGTTLKPFGHGPGRCGNH